MTTYTYDVRSVAPSDVTGDPLWTVVQYVDGQPKGGDHRWVRERYAFRAAALYATYPELHGQPSNVLREHGLRFDTDAEHERETAEHVERLRSAGFTVTYVSAEHVADARDNGRLHSTLDRHEHRHADTDYPHVDLARVAAGEDTANQTDTVRRSNYRSIRRDLDTVPWVDVSYANVDTLGAFVADLDADTVDILVKLADEYPAYDEDDWTALEHDEITASVRDYVIYDVARAITLEDSERWHDLDTDAQESMIFDLMREHDLYPEHNGYEVLWDYPKLAEKITARLS